MTKAVAKKQETDLAVASEFDNLGPEQSVNSNDIQIPKLLLMQGLSPKVKEQVCKIGDLASTLDYKAVANAEGESVNFLPFFWKKFWVYKSKDGNKWKFDSMAEINHLNEKDDPFEVWSENGKDMKRVYTHMFWGIVEGHTMPHTVAFKSASKKHGDVVVTQMYVINKTLKTDKSWLTSPMGKWMELQPTKAVSKDGDEYIELQATAGKESTLEEAQEALKWFHAVKSGEAKSDLNHEEEEVKYADDKAEF